MLLFFFNKPEDDVKLQLQFLQTDDEVIWVEEKQEAYVKWKSGLETGPEPVITLHCVPWAWLTQTLP